MKLNPIVRYIAQASLGALFLFSGIIKALDGQSLAYAVVTNYGMPSYMMYVSAIVPPLEVGLGLFLLLNFRTSLAALLACGCTLIFSAAIIYGTLRGDMESCGCFGAAMELSPTMALVRNAGLFLVAFWLRRATREAIVTQAPRRAWSIGIVLMLTALLAGSSTYRPILSASSVKLGQEFPTSGLADNAPDLSHGAWAIFAFHGKCGHCWDAMPQVETLTGHDEFQVIGLTDSSDKDLEEYDRTFSPKFPIYRVESADFRRMVKRLPDLWFVKDGRVKHKTMAAVNSWPIVQKHILPKLTR